MNKTERAATKDMMAVQDELEKRLLEAEAMLREMLDIYKPAWPVWCQRVVAFLERTG